MNNAHTHHKDKVSDISAVDRDIINKLQHGFPVSPRPFLEVATNLNIAEDELINRIEILLQQGVLTRFGPLFQVENMGGSFSLAAMKVPADRFDDVAEQVNQLDEVAHNYQRDHEFNMWFVIATEKSEEISDVIRRIEKTTDLKVYNMPKQQEFFVQLQLMV